MPGRRITPSGITMSKVQKTNSLNLYNTLKVEAGNLLALEKNITNPENIPRLKKFLTSILPLCNTSNNIIFSVDICTYVASELNNISKGKPSKIDVQLVNIIKIKKRLIELILSF